MRVLVACEFSGRVRDAFRALGHDAYSCDLVKSEGDNTYHIKTSVLNVLHAEWDLMVAFPPCTYLSNIGARFYSGTQEQKDALVFVQQLMDAPIERIAIENPVGAISTHIRKPDQIIHPYYFGDNFRKRTCLWLKGLEPLKWGAETGYQWRPMMYTVQSVPGGRSQSRNRSRTFPGIARAMAKQWGGNNVQRNDFEEA